MVDWACKKIFNQSIYRLFLIKCFYWYHFFQWKQVFFFSVNEISRRVASIVIFYWFLIEMSCSYLYNQPCLNRPEGKKQTNKQTNKKKRSSLGIQGRQLCYHTIYFLTSARVAVPAYVSASHRDRARCCWSCHLANRWVVLFLRP